MSVGFSVSRQTPNLLYRRLTAEGVEDFFEQGRRGFTFTQRAAALALTSARESKPFVSRIIVVPGTSFSRTRGRCTKRQNSTLRICAMCSDLLSMA